MGKTKMGIVSPKKFNGGDVSRGPQLEGDGG